MVFVFGALSAVVAVLPNRIVVCYKDVNLDPITDTTLKTINWRDPVLNRPEQTLMGVQYNDQSFPPQNGQGFFPSYVVTNSSNWVYAGTGLTDGTAVRGLGRSRSLRQHRSLAECGEWHLHAAVPLCVGQWTV